MFHCFRVEHVVLLDAFFRSRSTRSVNCCGPETTVASSSLSFLTSPAGRSPKRNGQRPFYTLVKFLYELSNVMFQCITGFFLVGRGGRGVFLDRQLCMYFKYNSVIMKKIVCEGARIKFTYILVY